MATNPRGFKVLTLAVIRTPDAYAQVVDGQIDGILGGTFSLAATPLVEGTASNPNEEF